MRVADYFVFPRTVRRMYVGPLGPHIDEFIERLQQQCFSKRSIQTKVRVVADFSRWLESRKLGVDDANADRVRRFLRRRKRVRRRTGEEETALREMMALVRGQDLAGVSKPLEAPSERDRFEQEFQLYLSQSRGLSATTVRTYGSVVSRFLSECFADGPVRFEALTGAIVTAFVQRHAHGHCHSRAQLVVKALRAFLRYLRQRGRISSDLAASVPSVAAWSLATLPVYLRPEQVKQVLEQCARDTACARRDYAMLLLFARLGLRAGEVAALTLDDIDWGAGCLALRGKGGRWVQMPLPQEVGEAIADYLTDGRPSCTDRRVFIRDQAPRTGFASSSGVSAVVSRALARAGIECPRRGAHVFRHSLATEMLSRGTSLAEIGQLLRHQHPDTTRIYAKVDLSSLRTLAPPWPGGTR